MAPSNQLGKRVKLTQIRRPFIVGSTAVRFSDANPKPPGTPDGHTHTWEVFVKGVDDTDVTYWLKRVQFKLHESIPNHIRTIEGTPGKPFTLGETGWGEFDIAVRLYYAGESGEKPQTLYHYLRLHPYGRTEEEKEAMTTESGEVHAWTYDEQLFNEPYEAFYNILTTGAVPRGFYEWCSPRTAAIATAALGAKDKGISKGKGKGKGKGMGKGKNKARPLPPLPSPPDSADDAWERTAMIPAHNRPGQPFSRETEAAEMKRLADARAQTEKLAARVMAEVREKEQLLAKLRAENQAATASGVASARPA